jgi:diguanylate cyclase (GGDEF)-like protein/PAS domain S-box-containing protein
MRANLESVEQLIVEQLRESDNNYYLVLDHNFFVKDVSLGFAKKLDRNLFDLYQLNLVDLPCQLIDSAYQPVDWSEHPLFTDYVQAGRSGRVNLTLVSFSGRVLSVIADVSFNDDLILILLNNNEESIGVGDRQRLLGEMFQASSNAIIILDANANIVQVNPAFERITGYSAGEVSGKNPSVISSGAHSTGFFKQMWQELEKNNGWQGVLINRKKSGELFSEYLKIQVIRGVDNRVLYYLGVFSEVSHETEVKKENNQLFELDVLTALPRRSLMVDRLEQALAYAKRHDCGVAVLYLDLDHFSSINENYGKETGDEIIKIVAERLHGAMRKENTLSRIGGDEFILVLRDLNAAFDLDEFVEGVIDTIQEPIEFGETNITVTVSLGIASFPKDDSSAEKLIRYANHAMGVAKSYGRACFAYHSGELEQERSKNLIARQITIEALKNDQYQLFAQPQFDLSKKSLYGLEFLLRWNSPDYGLVTPDKFLPDLKDKALLIQVDEWVVSKALGLIEDYFNDAGYNNINFGINLTPISLENESFHRWLEAKLLTVDPDISRRLEFEILETDALNNLDSVRSLIQRLEKFHVKFSLDDFGTGYSSLSIFNQLPVQSVKIDRSFVSQMVEDHRNLSLIKAICEMSKIFDRNVIAEGVEYQEQAQLLKNIGCSIVQGFGLFKPGPIEEVAKSLLRMEIPKEWLEG